MQRKWQYIQKTIKRDFTSWLILLPGLLLFVFFVWMPLLSNVRLSFYNTLGFQPIEFVGLDNYVAVLNDPLFVQALLNTLSYTIWSIIIGFVLPIGMALVLNEVVHFKGFFKTSLYIPNIIPGIASVIMWTFLMDPAPGSLFNSILNTFGFENSLWLDSPTLVIPLIVFSMTWKGAGATMLIYYAALQTIDSQQYEAAIIEGASIGKRIRYVTIPAILPNIRILFILQIIAVFQVFYEPWVMTDGGPLNKSISLLQLIYRYAYGGTLIEADKAAALGVMISLVLILLTSLYLKSSKKEVA